MLIQSKKIWIADQFVPAIIEMCTMERSQRFFHMKANL